MLFSVYTINKRGKIREITDTNIATQEQLLCNESQWIDENLLFQVHPGKKGSKIVIVIDIAEMDDKFQTIRHDIKNSFNPLMLAVSDKINVEECIQIAVQRVDNLNLEHFL